MVSTALLMMIYLSFISLGLPDSLLGSAWPAMNVSLNAPLWGAGLVQMLISFCTIISSLNSAKLIRRFGTGKLTAISVATTALALLGFSLAKNYAFLLLMAVPLGLGAGAVDVRLSVEFPDGEEPALLCGSSEVFKSKTSGVTPPWVEAAAVVYPQRGTMRIGLWLHDTVEGNRLRVHYFVQKPERDTDRILSQRRASVAVTPEFSRVKSRGKLQFQADVVGLEDKSVLWSVKEENGGDIDRNGLYQAPETPGTYEITAASGADESVRASAFVIVE